jgi:hypothetical protein
VFLEKSFDTPQHSGQQPPALPYAAPESDVLDNEPPMPQMSDTTGGPGSYGPWSQDQTAAGLDFNIPGPDGGTPTTAAAAWNEPPMPQMSDTTGGPGSNGPWSQDQTAAAGLDFNIPGPGAGTPTTTAATWTAVYDISAHTVYLPDGTKLEAHSGRGGRLDDPHYVHERMRGATPPNVYDLALREKTFHGVQALRLKPVGGGDTFGRSGLLAHTYMLGPKGESNGCVVFKNYNAFLQAFQNGQVKRLVVVDNLKVGKGYELTLAQISFAPISLKKSVFGDEPKFAGP